VDWINSASAKTCFLEELQRVGKNGCAVDNEENVICGCCNAATVMD
jgi:hypothetical protein